MEIRSILLWGLTLALLVVFGCIAGFYYLDQLVEARARQRAHEILVGERSQGIGHMPSLMFFALVIIIGIIMVSNLPR